jgi:hypothetical protein
MAVAVSLVTVTVGCIVAVLACCTSWLLLSGLQALTKTAPNKTLVRANRILRRRFMLISLV